jgi:predicted HicB family RNase H-like nuclease
MIKNIEIKDSELIPLKVLAAKQNVSLKKFIENLLTKEVAEKYK